MKKIFLFLSLFIVVTLACDLSVTTVPSTNPAPQPTNTTIPATGVPTQIPATLVPSATATTVQPAEVTVDLLTIVLQPGLASGVSGSQFPRADGQDLPYWELTPGHTVLKLEGYFLQGKLHEPQIYVYQALEYAQLFSGAFESMHRLRNVMYDPDAPIRADQLPAVPFFNAAQIFASNLQIISFQNSDGVRFLTEYGQYAAPVNNQELFYHFQGFSSDGEYYIVAIFPITAPVLAETSDAGAVLPSGGVAYPDINDPNADFQGYYASITDLLNATSPEAFTPTINQLDALIQSMRITP